MAKMALVCVTVRDLPSVAAALRLSASLARYIDSLPANGPDQDEWDGVRMRVQDLQAAFLEVGRLADADTSL